MQKAKRTQLATPFIVHDTPLAQAPWTVEPCNELRDTWTVRTSQGLVISPIFGKRNAYCVAGSVTMLAKLEAITEVVERGGIAAKSQLRKLAAEGIASATPPS